MGGKTLKFEVVSEDDGATPRLAWPRPRSSWIRREVRHGPLLLGVAIPHRVCTTAAAPWFSTVVLNPTVTQGGYPNGCSTHRCQRFADRRQRAYAANTMKLKKVGVVDDRTAFGQGAAEEFAKEAQKLGLTIVGREFTNDKTTDFMAGILTSLKGKTA